MKKWIAAAVAMLLCGCARDAGPTAADLVRSGESSWRQRDFLSAAALYEQAAGLAPDAAEPSYDLALSYYRIQLYDQALRYLDQADPLAAGAMLARCELLRGDIEYRRAMQENPVRRVEGLERALILYRRALGGGGALAEIARYDVEVVKLKLPLARGDAPAVRSAGGAEDVAPEESPVDVGAPGQTRKQQKRQERDW